MSNSKKQYDDDDGRVIASMDVDGMPKKGIPWPARRSEKGARNPNLGEPMTDSEARRFTWYAVLAGLAVVGVISLTWVLFILFLTLVWAR